MNKMKKGMEMMNPKEIKPSRAKAIQKAKKMKKAKKKK